MAIRFLKFAVTDGETKARVFYSLNNRGDARPCITLYERGYAGNLTAIFPRELRSENLSYTNNTDSQTDYFEEGHVTLFEGHPLYAAARARAEANEAQRAAKEVR